MTYADIYSYTAGVLPTDPAPTTTISVPDAPSAIAVRQSGAKVVEIALTFTEPAGWNLTELYRNTADDSATATLIEKGKKKLFHDENVSYGTTYYYWAKVVDVSGQKSAFSPSASHSILVAKIVTGDVTASAITATELADSAVETAKLNALAVTAAKIAANAVETAKINNNAVTTAKVVDSAVTTPKRQDVNRATSSVSHSHDTSVSKIVVSSHQVIHNLGRVVTVVAGLTSIANETTETRFVGVFYEANNVNDFTIRVVSVSVATGAPLGFSLTATLNMDYW